MTTPDKAAAMRARANAVLRNIENTPRVETPIYTNSERLRNYWNGYLAAINEITTDGTQ